ncbi:hypothetical protein [Streptomyces sp. AC495_CC817]|uniref:hypothetical protein n=1 Tax=Streptomyces sp. AC495_CC817 TaxID=2823900 RepID=UPI001C26C2F4|nr:hypothetical protein [Streptomyces sp. AC495_CC817]
MLRVEHGLQDLHVDQLAGALVDGEAPAWLAAAQVGVGETGPDEADQLKVVVRIVQTGGVKSTGTWTSLGDRVAVGQNATSDQIGYVITLKSGVTLDPGTYVFKAQYDHAQGGRDAGRDLYTVAAVANGSDDASVSGRF